MSFTKQSTTVEEGDTVIIYLGYDSMFPLDAKSGETTQTKYGAIKHNKLIGHKYGTKFQCTKGWVHILKPTPELWTISLPHRTQILYMADIAMVLMQLELKPGSVVCESGTGSGSLSHSVLRTIMPNGYLHTVEFHEQRAQQAREEFKKHGYGDIVTVYHRDVLAEGFPVENEADAVFLDIPKPWEAIQHAVKALKNSGGRLCSFSPCIEQVQRTCVVLHELGCFDEIETIELVNKSYNVKKLSLPVVDMGMSEPDVREALCGQGGVLPHAYEPGDKLQFGEIAQVTQTDQTRNQKQRGKERRGGLKRKHDEISGGERDKRSVGNSGEAMVVEMSEPPKEDAKEASAQKNETEKDAKKESHKTPPTCTKNAFQTRTCTLPKEIYGHTGYLTFATFLPVMNE